MTDRKVTTMAVPFRTDAIVVTLEARFTQRDLEDLITITNAMRAMSGTHAEIYQEFEAIGKQVVYCRSDEACAIIQRHLLARRVRFEAANY